MVVYPSTPNPQYPFEVVSEYKTLISTFETGKELAHQQWRFPKRSINLKYDVLSASEMKTLWDFYVAQKGSLVPFLFFDTYTTDESGNPASYLDEYVGRGNAATTTFDIPGKTTSARTIYLDGIADAGVTYQSGSGDGGADRVVFNTAPASGKLITVDFTGHIRYKMRFAQDKLSKELFTVRLYKTGIGLIERKPA